jgi:hypothetical protein
MSWITVSQLPLIATLNWCEEKCVAKVLQKCCEIEGIKRGL